MSQKYFITGASGGLGIELVKTVLNAGNTVVAAGLRKNWMSPKSAKSPPWPPAIKIPMC